MSHMTSLLHTIIRSERPIGLTPVNDCTIYFNLLTFGARVRPNSTVKTKNMYRVVEKVEINVFSTYIMGVVSQHNHSLFYIFIYLFKTFNILIVTVNYSVKIRQLLCSHGVQGGIKFPSRCHHLTLTRMAMVVYIYIYTCNTYLTY